MAETLTVLHTKSLLTVGSLLILVFSGPMKYKLTCLVMLSYNVSSIKKCLENYLGIIFKSQQSRKVLAFLILYLTCLRM